jgi:hypothetical protein
LLGALANISFIVGSFASLTRRVRLAQECAEFAVALSLLILLPLWLSRSLDAIYLGYGLWVASLLALMFASWHIPQEDGEASRDTVNETFSGWSARARESA